MQVLNTLAQRQGTQGTFRLLRTLRWVDMRWVDIRLLYVQEGRGRAETRSWLDRGRQARDLGLLTVTNGLAVIRRFTWQQQ